MKHANELKVGAIVVLAGLVFYIGNQFFNELPLLSGNMRYHTVLHDASGVVKGSAVFVSGVRIGAVTKVSLAGDGVRIRFDATRDALVTQGTTVAIAGIRSLGDLRLELALGPPSAPRLPKDSHIPYTSTSILDDVASGIPALAARVDSLVTQSIRTMSAARHLATDPSGDLLATLQTYRETAKVLESLITALRPQAESVLTSADSLAHRVDAVLVDSVAILLTDLRSTIVGMDATLRVVADAAASADELMRAVLFGDGSVARAVHDDSLYIELERAISSFNALMDDFQENPRKYLREMRLVDIF